MKTKLSLALIFIIGIFLISFISAESIGTFKIKEDVQLYQTCNNCTYCNLTSIKYPNSSNMLMGKNMTMSNTFFSYDLDGGNLSIIGTYKYCYECGNTYESITGCLDFTINGTGYPLDQPKAMIYLGLLFLLLVLFVIDIVFIPTLPTKDNYDEEGTLISINQLKYIRPILWVVAYLILMSITFIGSNVALAYMGENLIGMVLLRISQIMLALMLPGLVIWFIYIFYNIYQDKQLKEGLERGIVN